LGVVVRALVRAFVKEYDTHSYQIERLERRTQERGACGLFCLCGNAGGHSGAMRESKRRNACLLRLALHALM